MPGRNVIKCLNITKSNWKKREVFMDEHQNSLARDLTRGSVLRQLITFAAPLLASGLLQTVYNLVDAAVVGRIVGSNGLSAVSIGGDIMHMLTFLGMGFANAGQIIIAQFVGAGQKDNIRRMIGTLFTFMFGVSVFLTAASLLLGRSLLDWMNTPAEAWQYAFDYLMVCAAGLIFIYGYNLVSAILRGMGDSRHPFLFIAVATVINIVLDLLFVGVFQWAAFGAALATVIGQGASFILSIIFLYRNRERFGFDFARTSFRLHPDLMRPMVKLGIPLVLQSAAIQFSSLFITANINSYGVLASAVSGIGRKLDAATNVFTGSMSTAGGSMIGQNIGAEKYDRVSGIIGYAFLIDAAVCAVMIGAVVFFPGAVFGLFVSEADTIAAAMSYIPVAVLSFASCTFRSPMFALINGSGNARLNLIVGIVDGVLARIGLSLLLGEVLGLGIFGYWYGSALAGYVPFFVGGIYYLSGKWRTRKYIIRE